MHPFIFTKVTSTKQAINALNSKPNSKYIGGGTNIIDLMKMNIEMPDQLVDITGLDVDKIETLPNGNVRVGAMVRNSELAYHLTITGKFPLVSKALLSGASAQLRNMATTGGNLLQRTRCPYFYDTAMPCNKRAPGSGCSAITGYNRYHAILGTSNKCIATHPSDLCVALAAVDAIIHVQGSNGERSIPIADFYTLPGDTPQIENILEYGDLITHVEIPALPFASNSTYLKVRDRASYEFALTSAAVALDTSDGVIRNARIALGGVGTKPWRAIEAEQSLAGKARSLSAYTAAADIALKDAKTFKYNSFKTVMAKRTIIKALQNTGGIV